MKKKFLVLALAFCALAQFSNAIVYRFDLNFSGAKEVSGGDPDGTGTGYLLLNSATNMIRWNFMVQNISTLVGDHIHQAPVGVNGGVVYNFNTSFVGKAPIDPTLAASLISNPENYYVNIHTDTNRSGAVRDQLSTPRAVPDSLGAAWAALAIGLTLVGGRRVRLAAAKA